MMHVKANKMNLLLVKTQEIRVNVILHKMAQEIQDTTKEKYFESEDIGSLSKCHPSQDATKEKHFDPENTSSWSKFHPPQDGTRSLGCRKGDVLRH